ncbi:MAG: putative drug exporter of the superfamily [Thermomicrobiales bacterium]|jgi:RND superfamily putative drug exporter|nr:putative drug exporter of the superfamily [Thermomicrobiales bacterium]
MSIRSSARPAGALQRWARFSVRRRWAVLGAWIVALALLGGLVATAGGEFVDSFTIPGVESQKAVDLLTERFPSQAGDSATIVVRADAGVEDPVVRPRIDALLAEAATLPGVIAVVSPFDSPGAISADGTYAYATVQYEKAANEIPIEEIERLTGLVDRSAAEGLQVEVGGQIVAATEQEPPGSSELIGIAMAMVILLVMFGSVVAMGLPIVTALIGLVIGVLITTMAANVFDMSTFTPAFLSMIGLGVGIDYCLFIVTRYREGVHHGLSVAAAVERAIDTAGRAVIFAGTVVAIALLGLLAMGIPFVAALGIAAAIVVAASVLVAIGFLPMVLGFVGRRIDTWKIPGLGGDGASRDGFWFRWGRLVERRPALIGGLALAALLVLCLPYLDMRLGSSDAGNGSEEMHTKRAYDLLAEGFGPGFNGPLVVAVEQDGGLNGEALAELVAAMKGTEGVVAVSDPVANQANDTAVITVVPASAPQDEETTELVERLRGEVIPSAVDGTGANVYIGGATAVFIDLGDKIASRMPLFFAVVIGLSVILLAAVFRSVVIPIKAALMNLLSVGAAFGVVTAVFQWGWAGDLIGLTRTGPIESFLPMMLFGILFGLSMDYEVFLMTRVHEEHLHHRGTSAAMLNGVGFTARVIAAAAAIMGSVFLSFALSDTRVIKEFGIGLGVAILVDAFIVRLVLLPAVMNLLGERAWYMPAWLDRVLPKLNVEGPDADPASELPDEQLVPQAAD